MVTNNCVFYLSVGTHLRLCRIAYLYKSALSYKVSINKVHFKAGNLKFMKKTEYNIRLGKSGAGR
jgi:hypothetical protein